MTLTNHLIDTYEERGAPISSLHPPQSVQQAAGVHPISRSMQSQAGPSNYHGSGGGGMAGPNGGGEGSWTNHGMPWWMAMPPHLMQPQHSFTKWSEEKVAQMQVRLARKLGPEYVTQRPGPGGGPKLSYIEAWKVINLANEVFGFNGWSSSIVSLVTDFIDVNEQGRCSISVSAQVRITLKDGAYHEDIGSGQAENVRGKASALDKAKKEAVTDAIKRALRNFGNVLGNCLYDKSFTANVAKMKVGPPKWNPDELERRPEFTEAGGTRPSAAAAMAAPPPMVHPAPMRPIQQVPAEPPRPGTPLRSVNESVADQTMMTMDEHFDAEFLEGDDLFDIDVSRISDKASIQPRQTTHIESTSVQAELPAPPVQAHAVQARGAYQHRHRPDVPAQIVSGPSRSAASGPAAVPMQQSRSGPDRSVAPDAGVIGDPALSRSSGSSATAVEQNRPKAGAFIYPQDGTSDRPQAISAGQSARAQAIRAASLANVLPPPAAPVPLASVTNANSSGYPHQAPRGAYQPIRAESPRIPDGGIDAVAAKAAANYRSYAHRLELDNGIGADESPGMTVGGFASARGMKRVISGEDRNASPTKQLFGHPHQIQRNGPRRALGEIEVPDPEWNEAKRQRAI